MKTQFTDVTPPKTFPFLRSEGSPVEVGRNHGRAFGDQVRGSIGVYRKKFDDIGLDWTRALGFAERSGDLIRRLDPALAEELDGIAEGAELDRREILAINVRTGLIRMVEEVSDVDHECTTAAITGVATADGHTLMGQNWDQMGACQPNTVLIEQHVPGQPALLFITEAGILFRHGLNDAGVGFCGNALRSNREGAADSGLPSHMLRRIALRKSTMAGARDVLVAATQSHSGNHLIADADGNAVDAELVPGEAFLVDPEDGILVHSNHFQNARAKETLDDHGKHTHPDTLYRDCRVRDALNAKRGSITVEDVKAALQDHHGHPKSVCNHPDPKTGSTGFTLVSSIMDLNARKILTAPGPACVGTYTEYGFS